MSDDITFCFNDKCKNKKCMRHPDNTIQKWHDHSFALFEDCKYWDKSCMKKFIFELPLIT